MDQSSKTFDREIAPSTSKKTTRKTLKHLLELKSVVPEQASPSTSFDINIERKVSAQNEYVLPPSSFFSDTELEDYYEDFRSSATDRIFIAKINDLNEVILNFKKKPVVRNNFTQYTFMKNPTLALTTNAYGLVVGNSEDFTEKTVLPNLAALEPKHRVSLLLPTADHWWNKNSASTFRAFVERFANEIKSLAMDNDFKISMERFNQTRDVLINFKTKYLSATKVVNDEVVPCVFGVKMYNTNQFSSEINVPMAQIMDSNSLELSKGEDLVPPTFMHALLLLTITGFKITRSGISMDTEVNYLLYRPFQRLERKKQNLFTLTKHIIHEKSGCSSSTSRTPLGDVEEERPFKKPKPTTFEMD